MGSPQHPGGQLNNAGDRAGQQRRDLTAARSMINIFDLKLRNVFEKRIGSTRSSHLADKKPT